MTSNNTDEPISTENKDTSLTNVDESIVNQPVLTDAPDSNVLTPLSTDTNIDSVPESTFAPKVDENSTSNVEATSETVKDDNEKQTIPTIDTEVKSDDSSTIQTTNVDPNVFPPTPTNPVNEQERFNDIAKKSFTTPSPDEKVETNIPPIITTSNINTDTSEAGKPKKSPAPILKTNVQAPSDTVITLDKPTDVTQTPAEPELVSSPPPSTLPETSSKKKQRKIAIVRPLNLKIVSSVFLFFLAIIKAVIGWTYADECPIHWRIPHYLYIAGIIGLITLLGPYSKRIIKICLKPKPNEPNGAYSRITTLLSFVWIALSLFLFGWFIAGCVWVFRVYSKVTYANPNRSDYCHPVLYRFAFWLLLLTILYAFLQIFLICRVIRELAITRKSGAYKACDTNEQAATIES